jgi:FixJ family two-component response regulator
MDQVSDRLSSRPGSVLYVVDANEDERRSLVALLERLGREINCCDSAEAFLERLDDAAPFVLLAANDLPGIDGVQLLRELRQRAILAPTILISDDSDIQTAVSAIRAGAADFIERPFIDRILLRRVQAALETSEEA